MPMDTLAPQLDAASDVAEPRRRVSWLDRALPILDHLQETGTPLSTYAIANGVGAPLSTVYGVINALVDAALLVRRDDGTVWLGPRLYRYGLAYARSLDFLGTASREMETLCRNVGETVQICGRDGDDMVVLAMADGPGHFNVTSRVGTRVPLNWTASGRLLLGHLPPDAQRAAFSRGARPSPTGLAETDPERLVQEAQQAFAARLAIQAGVSDYMVACVASPLCNLQGECVASISIVLPGQKLESGQATYIEAVRAAARRIEGSLGWSGH